MIINVNEGIKYYIFYNIEGFFKNFLFFMNLFGFILN